MKYLLSILKRASIGRIQCYRALSSSVNNYNQLATTCDPQSDIYKVFYYEILDKEISKSF